MVCVYGLVGADSSDIDGPVFLIDGEITPVVEFVAFNGITVPIVLFDKDL